MNQQIYPPSPSLSQYCVCVCVSLPVAPLQVCVDAVQRVVITVGVLQVDSAGEAELVLVESELLQRLF